MELSKAKEIYRLGNTEFDFKKETAVMGILNVTPDSFSDGGKYGQVDAALKSCGRDASGRCENHRYRR